MKGLIAFTIVLGLPLVAVGAGNYGKVDPEFKSLLNVEYENLGHAVALDLYVDPGAARAEPLIIYIHGGGWAGRTKQDGLFYANAFLKKGYAFATIDYRLSPTAIFPAQIEDAKSAVRFLRAHAADYHIDPARFGVMGHSAGGHLAALLGTTNGDMEFEVGDKLNVPDAVQAVCDMSGPVDLTFPAPALTPLVAKLLGGDVAEKLALARSASPIFYVSATSAPFLILHGEKDPVIPVAQAQAFLIALQKVNVSAQLLILPGQPHDLNLWARSGPARYLDLVIQFFDSHLKNRP